MARKISVACIRIVPPQRVGDSGLLQSRIPLLGAVMALFCLPIFENLLGRRKRNSTWAALAAKRPNLTDKTISGKIFGQACYENSTI
jgi:hypothetical protein